MRIVSKQTSEIRFNQKNSNIFAVQNQIALIMSSIFNRKIIIALMGSFLLLSSCEKEDQNNLNSYRIKGYTTYLNGIPTTIASFDYNGDKLIRLTTYSGGEIEASSIHIDQVFIYENSTVTATTTQIIEEEILSVSRLVTHFHNDQRMEEYSYYQEGELYSPIRKQSYFYNNSLPIRSEDFNYHGTDYQIHRKTEYIYSNQLLKQTIVSRITSNGDWIYDSKYVLSRNENQINGFTNYHWTDDTWIAQYRQEYDFTGDKFTASRIDIYNSSTDEWEPKFSRENLYTADGLLDRTIVNHLDNTGSQIDTLEEMTVLNYEDGLGNAKKLFSHKQESLLYPILDFFYQ